LIVNIHSTAISMDTVITLEEDSSYPTFKQYFGHINIDSNSIDHHLLSVSYVTLDLH
jgi:hypothetical protein